MFNSMLINDGRPYGLGILASYPLNSGLYDDNGRFPDLLKTGPLQFTSNPVPNTGKFWAGTFNTAATFLRNPPALNVAMQGIDQWTIRFDNVAVSTGSVANNELYTQDNNFVIDRGSIPNGIRFFGSDFAFLSTTTAFTPGISHSLTVTWNGITRRLYVDDVLRATDTAPGKMPTPITNQWYGSFRGGGNGWSGWLSSVRVYNVAKVPPF